MAIPTAVNSQITDAVTESNVKAVAEAPAVALGNLYQSMAHSTSILFENSVTQQQNANTLAVAVLTAAVSSLQKPAGKE